MAISDVAQYFIDPSNTVKVTPAKGETVTVSAGSSGRLIITERVVYRDEVGPKETITVTGAGRNFATNSRDGNTVFQFSRR